MKKLIVLFLCLCLTAGILPALAESAPSFTVKNVPVTDGNSDLGSLDVRFYADTPNIPYIGIKAYMSWMLKLDVTVTAQEDGTWIITHPNGTTLVVNPSEGTLSAEDWARFQTPEPPYIKKKTGLKDTKCEWTEIRDIIFDDEPTPVTFDFAKYGIALYTDEADVYFPLAVISGLLEDESLNLMAYNGDKLFSFSGSMDNMYTFAPGYYEGEKMQALIKEEAQREEDQIHESYAELCFFVDYLYGFPGQAPLGDAIREKGLDAALDDLPDGFGAEIRQMLHSPNYIEYMTGLHYLFDRSLGDGHTLFMSITGLTKLPNIDPELVQLFVAKVKEKPSVAMNGYQPTVKSFPEKTRQEIWGDETYHEYGNTGIIRIDEFYPDEAGWLAWEDGKGEMPMDALGITFRGLEKAAANPDIKNIVFDLTINGGGSQDLMQAIIGMVTGDVVFSGYNELTKQKIHANVVTDRNMDGVIDEKDKDVTYPFNFGVLTTRSAFSCGNLFPILMQEKGAVVIGENSGGGSCVVNMLTLSDGPVFMLSSYQWHLTNSKGENVVEKGANPDIPIERNEITEWQNPDFPRLVPGDYTPYYNDEMLDRLMNEYFAQKEEPAA